MKWLNNERDTATVLYLLLADETSSTRIRLHLIELLIKVVPWEAKTTHNVAKITGYSSQTDAKSTLLKKTSNTTYLKWISGEQFLHRVLTPMYQHLCFRKILCTLLKEKCKHWSSNKPFLFTMVPLLQIVLLQCWPNFFGNSQL